MSSIDQTHKEYLAHQNGTVYWPFTAWDAVLGVPDDLAHKSDIDQAIEDLKATDLPVDSQDLLKPFTGTVKTMRINHVWYIRGNLGGYVQSDTASQLICDLPFSTDLITFRGSGDSGGSPVLVIFGNQLLLQKTVVTGGTVRFSWSIPEELL